MIRAMFTAATGMTSQQLNIDTVANNVANVNTTGFKKSRTNFQDLIYETLQPPGAQNADGQPLPEGVQVGHGVRVASVAKVHTQGTLLQTGREYDMAIEGPGFFEVNLAGSGTTAYTRDGSFRVNANGELVTLDGNTLAAGITIPPDSLSVQIGPGGDVTALSGDGTVTTSGPIPLVRFPNEGGLDSRLGRNTLLETEASGAPTSGTPNQDGYGAIQQGFLENSNVQVVEEILNLIVAQRAYEANSRVIETSDQMLQVATNIRG
jgi:flagellar basal-body rod protein FlgG